MISSARKLFSVISLSLREPVWLGEMSLANKGFNLIDKILEIILLVKLERLIGLKSEKVIALSILGMSCLDSYQ